MTRHLAGPDADPRIGADLAAAIVLFLALVVLLPNGIEVINAVLSLAGRAEFDWRDIVLRANEAPLSEGLFVLGMLVTTLVPTFVHITRGLAGIAAAWTPGAAEAAAGLRAWHTDRCLARRRRPASDAACLILRTRTAIRAGRGVRACGISGRGGSGLCRAGGEDERWTPAAVRSRRTRPGRFGLSRLWYLTGRGAALGLFVGLVAVIDAAGVSLGDLLVSWLSAPRRGATAVPVI